MSDTNEDAPPAVSRRRFIMIGAATPASRMLPAGVAALLAAAEARAQAALGDAGFATLTRMARDVYPHDRFDDKQYRDAIAPYGDKMAKDAELKKLLTEGVAALDAEAQKQAGKKYAEIANEADRVKVLKAVESTPFFKKVRGDLVVSLYNQPAVWGKLGYQGPSWQQGGYLKRGFDDQNWMGKA